MRECGNRAGVGSHFLNFPASEGALTIDTKWACRCHPPKIAGNRHPLSERRLWAI